METNRVHALKQFRVSRVTTGTWYTLRIETSGTTLRGYVNGALLLTATDSQFSSGNIGLGVNSGITGGGLNVGDPANDSTTPPPGGGVHNIIIRPPSLASQRLHRIQFCGTSRRDKTSQQRHCKQQDSDADKCRRICRLHSI